MELFDIKSMGIFNSQIFRLDTPVSEVRETAMFEIELPIENGGISYIDQESTRITPDLIICAKPGQKRHTKYPFKCYYIHINIHDSEMQRAVNHISNFIHIRESDREKYAGIYKNIIRYGDSKCVQDKYMVYAQILKLMSLLIRETEDSQNANHSTMYSHYVEMAVEYIDDHFAEKLTLAQVACAVSLSTIYFHNIFKASTGQTLHDYIEQKRIRKAIDLMQTTDMTLAEIAYFCGFSSQSYFNYAFKRRMDTTPRKYIQMLNDHYDI